MNHAFSITSLKWRKTVKSEEKQQNFFEYTSPFSIDATYLQILQENMFCLREETTEFP